MESLSDSSKRNVGGGWLNRLLVLTLAMQIVMTVSVAISFIVGCWMISKQIKDVDLRSVQTIIESVTHSALNIEMATERVLDSIAFATTVLNNSATSLDQLNRILRHPTLSVSLPDA